MLLPDKSVATSTSASLRGSVLLLLGRRQRAGQHDDAVGDPPAGAVVADRQGALRHRARLGLRVPDGERDAGADQSVDEHEPEWQNFGQRHHRHQRRQLGRPDRGPVGLRRADGRRSASATGPTPRVADAGFGVDEIAITGLPAGWRGERSRLGVHRVHAHERHGHAVVTSTPTSREYRQYRGYDDGLQTGPYNSGSWTIPTLQNWVEHFPYQDGLLVWYYDESFPDNNVGDNCAERPMRWAGPAGRRASGPAAPSGRQVWRPRVQAYDSTFGLQATDRICLHQNSVEQCYGGLPGELRCSTIRRGTGCAPNPAIGNFGWSSVPLPNTGTTIRVVSVFTDGTPSCK